MTNAVPALASAASIVREVAIVDDAFMPLVESDLEAGGAELLIEQLAVREELRGEANAMGITLIVPSDVTPELLDRFAQPDTPKGELYAAVLTVCPRLGERRDMLTLVKRLREHLNLTVRMVRPREYPDLRSCQVVFLDYYLEGSGSSSGGALAMEHARAIATQSTGTQAPLLVLMSSQSGVGQFKDAFRADADIYVGGFMFVAKRDLDEPWKLRAHLQMLTNAYPRAALIDAYVAALPEAIDRAKAEVVRLLNSLDIPDYSYLHNIALLTEGQPLGEYLSWLFSSHLASLVFERSLREPERAVNGIVFRSVMMTPSAPSRRVAEMYHSAQFERNVGPLSGHPHDQGGQVWLPMLRLGDVFVNEGSRRAFVILSAECDLAFGIESRPPEPNRSVIIVPGSLRDVRALTGRPAGPRTELYQIGENTYDLEWDFRSYVAKPLREVRWYLQENGCDLEHRVRLRPLYALKLQEEFASNVLRIGMPVAPPVFRAVRTEIWRRVNREATRVTTLENGETVIYFRGRSHHVLVSLEVAVALREAFAPGIDDLRRVIAEVEGDPESDPNGQRARQLRADQEAFIRSYEDEAFWESIIAAPQELPREGTPKRLDRGALYQVVDRGETAGDAPALDEVAQGKSCVIWRIVDAIERRDEQWVNQCATF